MLKQTQPRRGTKQDIQNLASPAPIEYHDGNIFTVTDIASAQGDRQFTFREESTSTEDEKWVFVARDFDGTEPASGRFHATGTALVASSILVPITSADGSLDVAQAIDLQNNTLNAKVAVSVAGAQNNVPYEIVIVGYKKDDLSGTEIGNGVVTDVAGGLPEGVTFTSNPRCEVNGTLVFDYNNESGSVIEKGTYLLVDIYRQDV